MSEKRFRRIEILDFLRGLAIINMIIYHLLYSLVFVFNVELKFFSIERFYPYQQYIAWSFILLSGFSVNLSKNPIKNSLVVIGSAILVSLITYIVTPGLMIRFGILHFMGLSMLLVGITKDFLRLINPYVGIILSFSLFIFIWSNGVEALPFYDEFTRLNLFYLGFPNPTFSSSDYFPLLPWILLFLTGFFIGRLNEMNENPLGKYNINFPIVNYIGKHSLIIYLLHQVIIYISLTILKKIGII
ncbi:MAG: DUF1624 domain-containing protein [Tissierellia bacterium]|nr:DUF1624 domain-containing protein [Tissierellia bacterium]